MKKVLGLALGALMLFAVAGCNTTTSDIVSENVSKDADQFKILRRVVFYNGITGEYMLTIEGFCSLGNNDGPGELTVVCKYNDGYKKNFLGLSDNVTYFVEQLESADVNVDHYKVIFKPSVIIPDIDIN